MKHIKTWKERVANLDKPTDFVERCAAIEEAAELRRFIAALGHSDAAQAPTRYFVYDNDGGYEEFDTDAERDKAHQTAIEGYLDDGWSEEVTSVVSGIVTHRTVQTDVEHRPPRCTEHPEQDNDDCDVCVAWGEFPNHDFDMCCRYEPEQIAAPVAPAAAAQAEAGRPAYVFLAPGDVIRATDERYSVTYHRWKPIARLYVGSTVDASTRPVRRLAASSARDQA